VVGYLAAEKRPKCPERENAVAGGGDIVLVVDRAGADMQPMSRVFRVGKIPEDSIAS